MAEVLFRAKLQRGDSDIPWGFRLQGGVEYSKPLTLLKVTESSIAAKSGLHAGDIVVKLASQNADAMTHKKAQKAIVHAGNVLEIIVERADATIGTNSDSSRVDPSNNGCDDGSTNSTHHNRSHARLDNNIDSDMTDLSSSEGSETDSPDTLDIRRKEDTDANTATHQESTLREIEPPLDNVICRSSNERQTLDMRKKDDNYMGSMCNESRPSENDSNNAQSNTIKSVINQNVSASEERSSTRSKGLSYLGWSSSDSDDSLSVQYPARQTAKNLLKLTESNSLDSNSMPVKDSKYPWRKARDEKRNAKLHVRSVSEPARSTQPNEMISVSKLPKKSISVANLPSTENKSSKAIRTSLESVSEEIIHEQCHSQFKKSGANCSRDCKKKLVKQNAMTTDDIEHNDIMASDDEVKKISNAEYGHPSAEDIHFAAKNSDKVLSLPQVKSMVADLNNRLETLANNHPALVKSISPTDIGLAFGAKHAKDKLNVSVSNKDEENSSSGDDRPELVYVERERSLDTHPATTESVKLTGDNQVSENEFESIQRTSSPSKGRQVHFGSNTVFEIEPRTPKLRPRRREDKYPEFYGTQTDNQKQNKEDIAETNQTLPVNESAIDSGETHQDLPNASPSHVKNEDETDSKEMKTTQIPDIAYASNSVKELAERLDKIERQNELFKNSKEANATAKPVITRDITGRTYSVIPTPVTPVQKMVKEEASTAITVNNKRDSSPLEEARNDEVRSFRKEPSPVVSRQIPMVSNNTQPKYISINSKITSQRPPQGRRTSLQPTSSHMQPTYTRQPNHRVSPQRVPISMEHQYLPQSSASQHPIQIPIVSSIPHMSSIPTHHSQATPRTTYTIEPPSDAPPKTYQQHVYQSDHLSPTPPYHRLSPQRSPMRSPVRSPNRSPVPPPHPRQSPVSRAELDYYKKRLLPQESPPPYSLVKYNDMYRRFPRRNSTGGVMLSTSNMGPRGGISVSIDGQGGPINVYYTQQRPGDPTTQLAFQIPRETHDQQNHITYSITPDVTHPRDSVSFNYSAPHHQSQPLLYHTQGGSYDDSKVIHISCPQQPAMHQQRRSPNTMQSPEYQHQDYSGHPEYFIRPVKPEPQYPEYYPTQAYQMQGAIPKTSNRTHLSPTVQQIKPPPPYPYASDVFAEDTSALSQSKSFKNLENKFLLGGNTSPECTPPLGLPSTSSRKSSGVSVQAERGQVPQPAASARPYIPPAVESRGGVASGAVSGATTPDELDMEMVEKQAIERFMREQMHRQGEVYTSDRTPPGLFAFFDKSFSDKIMERQYRRHSNYMPSETLRLVKEMDLQKRYEGNQQPHYK